jgi:hypothetical protein
MPRRFLHKRFSTIVPAWHVQAWTSKNDRVKWSWIEAYERRSSDSLKNWQTIFHMFDFYLHSAMNLNNGSLDQKLWNNQWCRFFTSIEIFVCDSMTIVLHSFSRFIDYESIICLHQQKDCFTRRKLFIVPGKIFNLFKRMVYQNPNALLLMKSTEHHDDRGLIRRMFMIRWSI